MLPCAQIRTPHGEESSGKRGKRASHAESRLSKGPVLNPALPKSFPSSWASAAAGWGGISTCLLSIPAPSRQTPELLGKMLQGHYFQTQDKDKWLGNQARSAVRCSRASQTHLAALGWGGSAEPSVLGGLRSTPAGTQLSFSN